MVKTAPRKCTKKTNATKHRVPTLQSKALKAVAEGHKKSLEELHNRQEKEKQALVKKHQKEIEELKNVISEENSKPNCFSCGNGVDVEKGSSESFDASVCCYCNETRKCPDCKWPVECAYETEHGFCLFCESEANICDHCDGGCIKCQEDAGCCHHNGGRPR